MIMIVSLRLPMFSRLGSAAPAHCEFGSTQALASLPAMRKFCAFGSAAGNVSGTPVLPVDPVSPGALELPGPLGPEVLTWTAFVCSLRSSCCLAYTIALAPTTQAITTTMLIARTARCTLV